MKIFTLEYSGRAFQNRANLGDDIQIVAARRLLPKIDGSISQAELSNTDEKGVISINGFFLGGAGQSWPPSDSLEPFYYSFHITKESQKIICSEANIEYLKRYEPIGCRDRGTLNALVSHGVDAFYSKCISLTFERRERTPKTGDVFLVDLSNAAASIVPSQIRKRAVVVTQAKLRLPGLSAETRQKLAEGLLETYAQRASLVVTSKIHCAMPCIAMGIPVVFLYDRNKRDDYRVAIIDDLIGINYVRASLLARKVSNRFYASSINWNPDPVDIEDQKKVIAAGYLDAFQRAATRFHNGSNPSK